MMGLLGVPLCSMSVAFSRKRALVSSIFGSRPRNGTCNISDSRGERCVFSVARLIIEDRCRWTVMFILDWSNMLTGVGWFCLYRFAFSLHSQERWWKGKCTFISVLFFGTSQSLHKVARWDGDEESQWCGLSVPPAPWVWQIVPRYRVREDDVDDGMGGLLKE